MPYGVTDAAWRMLPPDDQAAIKASYNNQPTPQQGGYNVTAPPASYGPPASQAAATTAAAQQTPAPSAPTPPAPATSTKLPDLDWASTFFASLGLPSDVVSKVNQIFTQYSDTNAASAAALAYIRGTTWYADTYPGIQAGIQKGVISNEADYRNLLNQQSQVYKQYLGRDVSASEFAANLGEGAPLSTIGGRLQGAALAGTFGNDWRYTLGAFDTAPTSAEVTALGQEQAGLDSPLGQQVQRRLDLAKQRLQNVFSGTLATPNLSLANGRLTAPGLGASQADVGA